MIFTRQHDHDNIKPSVSKCCYRSRACPRLPFFSIFLLPLFVFLGDLPADEKKADTLASTGTPPGSVSGQYDNAVKVPEFTFQNSMAEPRQPAFRLVGRAIYESQQALVKNGQVYLFFELNKDAEYGDNTTASKNSPDANDRNETFFKTNGFVTIKATIPNAGTYYPAMRSRQHGNDHHRIAVEIDGKEVSFLHAGGKLHWTTPQENELGVRPIDLPAGPVTIVLRETKKSPGQNVNMAFLDIFALSTEKNTKRYNTVTICPFDSTNAFWLPRVTLPLVDPVLTMAGCTVRLKGTLQDGEPVWIFPDGTTSSASGLKAAVEGSWPSVAPGGSLTVALTAAAESSRTGVVTTDFTDVKLLKMNTAIVTPNDDGLTDSVRFETAGQTIEIRDAITGKMLKLASDPGKDGYIEWPVAGELPPPSFYEAAVPGFSATSRQVTVIRVKEEASSAWAEPAVFSPNGDLVYDTSVFIFTLTPATNASVRVVDAGNQQVRELAAAGQLAGRKEFVWDGRDGKEKLLPNGAYRFQVVDAAGVVLRSTTVKINNFRVWKRAPIQTEPDFFPMGVYYGPSGNHPKKLTGTAYHDAIFKDLREHNLNTIICNDLLAPEMFDLAETNGIRLIPSLTGLVQEYLSKDEEEAAKTIEDKIAKCRDKPALLAYYISDEPSPGNLAVKTRIFLGQRILEGIDPGHPPISCLIGLGSIKQFYELLTPPVFFIDLYPVSLRAADTGDFGKIFNGNTSLTDYTNQARSNLKDGRPFWTVVQAHNFGPQLRTPLPVEMRLQVGCSLAYGTKGIIFFLYHPLAEMIGFLDYNFNPTPAYEESKIVCGRVQKLAPLLLKLQALEPVVKVSGNPVNTNFAMVSGTFRGPDKALYLIVVNTFAKGQSAITVEFDRTKIAKAKALMDQETQERIPVETVDQCLAARFNMEPGDFRVFKVDGGQETAPLRFWHEMSPSEQGIAPAKK